MTVNLTNKIFNDVAAARAHLESIRWPDGPVCGHCGECENVKKLAGKSTRPGVYYCNSCEKPFTVTVGSVMERSKIPLTKWVLGFYLMAASKKGVSSHQLHRMLGITYKSAWFLSMRIREAMHMEPEVDGGPDMGGEGKIVESDETFIGGKAKNVHNGKPEPKKHPVVALVERGGKLRARHVPNVTAKSVREVLKKHVRPETPSDDRHQLDQRARRQGLQGSQHGQPQPRRVRARRRLHQHGGELLCWREAEDLRHPPRDQ